MRTTLAERTGCTDEHSIDIDPEEQRFLREKIVNPLRAHFYHALKASIGGSRKITPQIREQAAAYVDLGFIRSDLEWILGIRDNKALTETARRAMREIPEENDSVTRPHEYCLQAAERIVGALPLTYGGAPVKKYAG